MAQVQQLAERLQMQGRVGPSPLGMVALEAFAEGLGEQGLEVVQRSLAGRGLELRQKPRPALGFDQDAGPLAAIQGRGVAGLAAQQAGQVLLSQGARDPGADAFAAGGSQDVGPGLTKALGGAAQVAALALVGDALLVPRGVGEHLA